MINLRKLVVLAASLAALAACAKTAAPDTAADETAARAVNIAWYKAYNAGDGAAVAALYSEDAVLNAPGAPAARGKASISEYFVKGAAATAAEGEHIIDIRGWLEGSAEKAKWRVPTAAHGFPTDSSAISVGRPERARGREVPLYLRKHSCGRTRI